MHLPRDLKLGGIPTKGTKWYTSFFLHPLFTLSNIGFTTPGTYNPNARGSDAFKESRALNQNVRQICGQQNVRSTAKDNTGQNTDKAHTSSPRIVIKY